MSLIRSKGNKATELKLMAIFRESGIKGWRRNQHLHGKPDFLFRKQRVVIFVDGCFWHGCPKHLRMPQDNRVYWLAKIRRNAWRDKRTNRLLRKDGWSVLRIWEHELKTPHRLVRKILRRLGPKATLPKWKPTGRNSA